MSDEREGSPELRDALRHLHDRMLARTKPLDPWARDILYANLWDLYDDGDPQPARFGSVL